MICLGCDYNKRCKILLISSIENRKRRLKTPRSVCLGRYLLSLLSFLKPNTSSYLLLSAPWLTAVTTCCANWKRPWLVLFPNRSGWCPVVFLSAGGWQLAFRLRRSAVWTLASLFRPLAPLPPSLSLFANTHLGPTPHGVGGNRSRHLFLSCRNYSGENCSRINGSGPQEVKKKNLLMVLAASRRHYSCIILFTH